MTKRLLKQCLAVVALALFASYPMPVWGQQERPRSAQAVVSPTEGFGEKSEEPKAKPTRIKLRPKSGSDIDRPGKVEPAKEPSPAAAKATGARAVRRDPSAKPRYKLQ
jgi:hypothetical protein